MPTTLRLFYLTVFYLAVAVAMHSPTNMACFQRLTADDLLVLIDFDRTLTTGPSDQCHDILGESSVMPPSLRASFEPLLDFSKPFPPELQGDDWWRVANQILLAHADQIKPETVSACVSAANVRVRPGASRLLRCLSNLGVPVLIVSAGYSDVVEAVLETLDVDQSAYTVASNRLCFVDGKLVAVLPEMPVTGFNKRHTYARNEGWFAKHAGRKTLLLIGDRLSDLDMGKGVADGYSLVGVGIRNDAPDGPPGSSYPSLEAYATAFDALVLGDEGSLEPLAEALEAPAR